MSCRRASLRAYRQLGRFESRANFGTWLYRIVANCSVDLMRSKQARHDQVRGDSLDDGAMELPAVNAAGTGAAGAERGDRTARAGRAARVEPARTRGVHAAALRRTIDRRDQRGARIWEPVRPSTVCFAPSKKLRVALAPLRSQES